MKNTICTKYSILVLVASIVTAWIAFMPLATSEAFESTIQQTGFHDISQLMMHKYLLDFNGKTYEIFYRFLNMENGREDKDATVSSINIDATNSTLVIKVENIMQTDFLSLRIPQEIISAENEKFTIIVDGKEIGYELSYTKNDVIFGIMLQEGASKIQIIGTAVMPEFGVLTLLILSCSVAFIVFFSRNRYTKL